MSQEPVSLSLNAAIGRRDGRHWLRLGLLDALEWRFHAEYPFQCEVLRQVVGVNGRNERQRLNVRREYEPVVSFGEMQGPGAESVGEQVQLILALVVDDPHEIAVESRDEVNSMRFVKIYTGLEV